MALLAQVSTQKLFTPIIQSSNVTIFNTYGTPGYLTTGFLTLATSSSVESYSIGTNSYLTGSVSTLGLLYTDGITPNTGSIYISSLYLGNFGGTTSGQITTDATATNLFWNGSQLNNQGGGGGGGAIDYISAFTVSTNLLQVSSIQTYLLGEPISVPDRTIFTGKLTNDTELNGKGIINITGSIRGRSELVVSTIGADPIFLTINDLALKYIMTSVNITDSLYLPDPAVVQSGWNIFLYNNFTSVGTIDVYDYNSNLLFNMAPASYYPFTTDGANWYPI